jgi:PAS domain S-box-containing protein
MVDDHIKRGIAFKELFKRFISIYIPISLLLALIILIIYRSEVKIVKLTLEKDQKKLLDIESEAISLKLRPVITDVLYLSKEDELYRVLNNGRELNIKQFEHELFLFSKRKGVYDQISILDERGMEVLRIDHTDGESYIVPKEKLKSQVDSINFKATMKIGETEIHISPMHLKLENGKVVKPHKPIIRLCTPLFDKDGKRRGVLDLHYIAQELFESLHSELITKREHISLINKNGYLLHHYEKDLEYGFMLEGKNGNTFKKIHPGSWEQISKAESGQLYNDEGLFTWERIYPYLIIYTTVSLGAKDVSKKIEDLNKDLYWTIVSHISKDKIKALSRSILKRIIAGFIIIFIAVAIGIWIFVKINIIKKLGEDELKKNAEMISMISNTTQDAIITIDSDSRVTYWNPGASNIFGYTKDEAMGYSIRDLVIPEKYRAKYDYAFKKFQETGEGTYIWRTVEITALKKNGEEIPIELSLSPIREKDKWSAIAIIRDITARKHADETLYNIAFGVTGTTSEEIFQSLVKYLQRALRVSYVYVAELQAGAHCAKTISVCAKGEFVDNFKYDLIDTPCENVLNAKKCTYPRDVREKFPKDKMLADMKIESYAGTPLKDLKGNVLGIMAALDEKPFENPHFVNTMLRIFAIRASTELERMKTEEALRESEANLKEAQHIAHLGSWGWDIKTGILTWSDEVFRIFGLKPQEFTATYDYFYSTVHDDDKDYVQRHVDGALYNKKPYGIDYRIILPDGEERIVFATGAVTFDDEEKPVRFAGTVQDITERNRAEEALRESDKKIRDLIETIPHGVQESDTDGRITLVNKAYEKITGYTKDEVLKKYVWDMMEPGEQKDILPEYLKHLVNNQPEPEPYVTKNVTKDGRLYDVQVDWAYKHDEDGKVIGFYSVLSDITERKIAERESRENYLNKIGVMVVAVDENNIVNFINKKGCEILGYDRDEIIGKDWCKSFLPEGAKCHDESVISDLFGQKRDFIEDYESRVLTKRGEERVIRWNSLPLLNDQGKARGVICTGEDVTNIMKIEEKVKLHGIRLQSMLELNKMTSATEEDIFAFVTDEALKVTQSKIAFIGLMNEDESVFIQHSVSKNVMKECAAIINPAHFTINDAGIWADAVRKRKPLIINDYSAMLPAKKGYPAGHMPLVRLLVAPVFDNGKIVALACVGNKDEDYKEDDVNALTSMLNDMWRLIQHKRSEEEKQSLWNQLLLSQKLESVGRLTGGLAHDFNNILTTTIGFSSLAMEMLPEDNPVYDMVNRIYNSGKKASNLIDRLLAFSRKQVLEMKVYNLNQIVNSIIDMLSSIIGEDITLKVNTTGKVKNIIADETQVEQILMNLVVNSRDAMHDGGILTIETEDVKIDEDFALSHYDAKAGDYVVLSVKDTGIGIRKDVMENIFEPFFTTKKEGKGSGLGLSTVFGIVKQHGGFTIVESEPLKGSTFKVYLPAVEKEPAEEALEERLILEKGTETILVVEDDNSIRKLFVDILEPLGYKVLDASSGEEALDISYDYPGNIDVLLTDVVMQGINGWELNERIQDKRPGIKTIFTSGFVDNPIVIEKIQKSPIPFIKKPLSPKKLIKTLQELLDKKA